MSAKLPVIPAMQSDGDIRTMGNNLRNYFKIMQDQGGIPSVNDITGGTVSDSTRDSTDTVKSTKMSAKPNGQIGIATLIGGQCMVNNTAVTLNSHIFLSVNGVGGTPGIIYEDKPSRVAGRSFTIKSSDGADTSKIAWMLVEPS